MYYFFPHVYTFKRYWRAWPLVISVVCYEIRMCSFFLKYSQICYPFLLFIYNFIYSLFIYSSYLFLVFLYISDLCRLPPSLFSSNSLSLSSPLSSSTSSLSLSLVHVLSPFSSITNSIY